MHQFIKKLIYSFFLLVAVHFSSSATHAIGGELNVSWSGRGTIYNITYNLYINVLSANQNDVALSYSLPVTVFDKTTRSALATYSLPLKSDYTVSTVSDYCTPAGYIQTNLITYTSQIDLYYCTSPNGYYLTMEYCCRNEELTNIQDAANTVFASYLEFPSISYHNSSPAFKPQSNQYFCTKVLNTFDFSATDANGDSLVYRLISPLQASGYQNRDVTWKSAHSGTNPFQGTPGLSIDPNTGIMSFVATETGICLFGVKVEEYRNKKKIGEVRRDYQFTLQQCIGNGKPSIGFDDPLLKESDTISINLKDEKCVGLYFTDEDAATRIENLYTLVSSGKYPLSAMGVPSRITVTPSYDTAISNVCFKPCLAQNISETSYYPISIIVRDRRCPEKFDTLLFTLKVVVPDNAIPKVSIDPYINPHVIKVDSSIHFNVLGTDADPADLLSLTIYGNKNGMSFKNVSDSTSTISSAFNWTPNCSDLSPGVYTVYFIIKDNSCIVGHADTVYQTIVIEDNAVSFDSMRITNLVTPNNDQLNDYYYIPGIPAGNCAYFFKNIEIFNVWGSRVFFSEDKNFKWYPKVSDGIYYFSVDLNQSKRSGWIQVLNNTSF
ncbi:MAG: gliding motility-associated C-terminal domain-containing protein [Cytophagales bacterium]|nr:gliding motility-associated C-terminal domain-containing protein [Cytophaga sp.]